MSRKTLKTRSPQKQVLVLCEGHTEERYLKAVKNDLPRELQRGITVNVVRADSTDLKSLTDEAIKTRQKANRDSIPYEKIWLVFDHDNSLYREYAFNTAKKEGFEIAFTSISIEVWFLLHFEYSTSPFNNGGEAKKYLAKKHIPNYKPAKTNTWLLLNENTKQAITNAEKMRKAQQVEIDSGKSIWNINPYTNLDILIKYLQSSNK